ncbi:MAG: OFA family MFS transporter [Pseudomonadota bacterium]
MEKIKNRWLIAASAVGVHISIGSVYAYSVWILPLNVLLGWSKLDIVIAFSIAIFFLGFSAALLGPMVSRIGPRKSGTLAALFYGVGALGCGLAVSLASLPLFILSYGVLGGIGLGIGYITPVTTLIKWFPDKRGLATGIAIMGFGFASMVFGPIIAKLCEMMDPSNAFYILGIVYFFLIFCSAQYLAPPPNNWILEKEKALLAKGGISAQKREIASMTIHEARRTTRFYYMWIMMFINICCGIALISVASPMAQEVIGLTALQSASLVGIMGLFNGLGRIAWSSLSDYIGRPNTFIAFFVIQIAAFMLLTMTESSLVFQTLLLIIMTCYGGAFATLPAFLSDMFGAKQLGAIHGAELTAWAMAGLVGPAIVSYILEFTGNYNATLYIFTGFFVVAFIVSLMMARNIAMLHKNV